MTSPGGRLSLMRALRFARGPRRAALTTLSLIRRIAWAPPGVYPLCYHHFTADSRANFERQLDHLARHGRFVGADQAVAMLRSGKPVTERLFLVTVDDGYADLVDIALPVLLERGVPAIAFIVGSWLDDPPETAGGRAEGYMSRADLETWRGHGMEVGSHGDSHAHMIGLSDDEARAELRRSSVALAEVTGEAPRHFAVPWGKPGRDFKPERACRLAEAEGYVSLFTTERGIATGPADVGLMPRHGLEPEWAVSELDALMGASPFRRNATDGRRRWNGERCRSSS